MYFIHFSHVPKCIIINFILPDVLFFDILQAYPKNNFSWHIIVISFISYIHVFNDIEINVLLKHVIECY